LEKAEAEAELFLLTNIKAAATDGKWTAAAWILERRHPERWAKLEKREYSGTEGGPIEINVKGNIDPDKL